MRQCGSAELMRDNKIERVRRERETKSTFNVVGCSGRIFTKKNRKGKENGPARSHSLGGGEHARALTHHSLRTKKVTRVLLATGMMRYCLPDDDRSFVLHCRGKVMLI